MQLAIIVQLSIAMLATEFAGLLPIDAWVGVSIALTGPLAALLMGMLLAHRAHRGMNRFDRRGVERLFTFNARAPWLATMCMAVAAMSALPVGLDNALFDGTSAVFLMACALTATLATYFNASGVERRLREAAIVRQLDSKVPLQSIPTRAAYVLAQARAGLLPMLAPLLVPLLLSQIARVLAQQYYPDYVDEAQFCGAILGALLLLSLVSLLVPRLLGLHRLAPGELRSDLESLARDAGVGVREIWVWPTDGLVANAAVMGMLPGLRCVMLSDALLECMPRDEVRAVMAHELGHVARKHLPWMIVVVLACWTLAGFVATPIAEWSFNRLAIDMDEVAREQLLQGAVVVRDLGVLVMGLCAFGFASRRFERQADSYAVQLLSSRVGSDQAAPAAVDAMVGALGSVALLNHVAVSRGSWRHGSIAWRQEYLRNLQGRAHGGVTQGTFAIGGLANDSLITCIRWGALAVIIAGWAMGLRLL